jgi:hypothetical protein
MNLYVFFVCLSRLFFPFPSRNDDDDDGEIVLFELSKKKSQAQVNFLFLSSIFPLLSCQLPRFARARRRALSLSLVGVFVSSSMGEDDDNAITQHSKLD